MLVARFVWCWVALIMLLAVLPANIAPIGAQAQSADDLAALRLRVRQLHSQGKYTEAIPLAERYVSLARQRHGEHHIEYATAISSLAQLYRIQGRYAEAEPLYKRGIAIREKALGPEHPNVGNLLNNLAQLYRAQGRYAEAVPLYKRALAILEKALGPEHADVGNSLTDLAVLYREQGRYTEAEPLYKRGIAIREKALGADHPDVGSSFNSLAILYRAQGRYAEAEPLYKRALSIREKALGPDHQYVGKSLSNIAELYRAQARYAEAEPLFKRGIAIREKALGADHPAVGTSLSNLAVLYRAQGRYAEAEPLFKRALSIREKALGPDHPAVGASLHNLAELYFAQSDWTRAADFWRRSTAITIRRVQRGTRDLAQALTDSATGEAERLSYRFWALVKAVHRLGSHGDGSPTRLAAETFQIAQWTQNSDAAESLAQMSARQAKGSAPVASLVRERQDLAEEWQTRDKLLIAAISQTPDARKGAAEQAQRAQLAAVEGRIAEIDRALANDFPDYAALVSPEPLTVPEVQTLLGGDEALLLFSIPRSCSRHPRRPSSGW